MAFCLLTGAVLNIKAMYIILITVGLNNLVVYNDHPVLQLLLL